jgi:hypothetical protein
MRGDPFRSQAGFGHDEAAQPARSRRPGCVVGPTLGAPSRRTRRRTTWSRAGAALRAEIRRCRRTRRDPERQSGCGERRAPTGRGGRTRQRADLPLLASHGAGLGGRRIGRGADPSGSGHHLGKAADRSIAHPRRSSNRGSGAVALAGGSAVLCVREVRCPSRSSAMWWGPPLSWAAWPRSCCCSAPTQGDRAASTAMKGRPGRNASGYAGWTPWRPHDLWHTNANVARGRRYPKPDESMS